MFRAVLLIYIVFVGASALGESDLKRYGPLVATLGYIAYRIW